jgi:hypothetical protein
MLEACREDDDDDEEGGEGKDGILSAGVRSRDGLGLATSFGGGGGTIVTTLSLVDGETFSLAFADFHHSAASFGIGTAPLGETE